MKAEWAAFRARLGGHPVTTGKVYPIVRKDEGGAVRDNYVIATSHAADRLDDGRLAGSQMPESDQRYTYDVRIITTAAGGLDIWADAVFAQLLGHRLVVPGRRCTPIELVQNVEEGDGYDRVADLFWRDLSFRFWSRRAPEEIP